MSLMRSILLGFYITNLVHGSLQGQNSKLLNTKIYGNSFEFGNIDQQCPAIDRRIFTPKTPETYLNPKTVAVKMCLKYMDLLRNVTNGCLTTRPSRKKRLVVSNGSQAKDNEFRHMALLGFGSDWKNATWSCGGSLISDRYVLTAGHCISTPDLGKVKYVTFGITRRSLPLKTRHQCFDVISIRTPLLYKAPKRYHDIALLKTDKRVILDSIMPACLHTGEFLDDLYAQATGFGALGDNKDTSTTLQKVNLHRFPEDTCRYFYRSNRNMLRGYDHNIQMCYGDLIQTSSTCPGDSGGPLQVKHPELDCMFVIIGITSSGNDCGKRGPGIYTRVSEYVRWIESIVWPDKMLNTI